MNHPNRRQFLVGAGAATLASALPTSQASAQTLVRCEAPLQKGALDGQAIMPPKAPGVGDLALSETSRFKRQTSTKAKPLPRVVGGSFTPKCVVAKSLALVRSNTTMPRR